jgi:hypothetical protein
MKKRVNSIYSKYQRQGSKDQESYSKVALECKEKVQKQKQRTKIKAKYKNNSGKYKSKAGILLQPQASALTMLKSGLFTSKAMV